MQKSALAVALFASATVFAGDEPSSKKVVVPPAAEDSWKFLLAAPGWMAGLDGDIGLNGVNSNINLGFDKILPKLDMIWATRAEVSKGRFGILGELIYLSMSDGADTNTVVKKVDVRVDEYLADLTLRYRVIEGPRGYVDVLAGVRYTNMYNAVSLRPNDERISAVATNFSEDVSARIRERIQQTLSEGRFRNALESALSERITDDIATITGPNPKERSVPNRALAYRTPGRIGALIERLVERQEASVVAAASADLQQAEAAQKAALRQTVDADKAKLQRKAASLRERAELRIANAQKDLEKKVTKALQKGLNQDVSLTEDWWDPYVGLRARYNFTQAIYVIGRGDIGGFGVGSDLMWQAEGALGFQLTRTIYTELGYRALSFNYDKNGFLNDSIMHGAQVTLGFVF